MKMKHKSSSYQILLVGFFCLLFLTACSAGEAQDIPVPRDNDNEVLDYNSDHSVQPNSDLPESINLSSDSVTQDSSQSPTPTSDQSVEDTDFEKVFSFLANLARNNGSQEQDGDDYTYQFNDGDNGSYYVLTDSKGTFLSLVRVGYNLKYMSSFSMVFSETEATPCLFWFQEYEYEGEGNSPVAVASSMINPAFYQGANDIAVDSDTFSSSNYKDEEIEAEAMADNVLELLYTVQNNLLLPNGFTVENLGFTKILKSLDEMNIYEDSLSGGDERGTRSVSTTTDESDFQLPDAESYIIAEVDGVEKTFYVGRCYEGSNGGFWYTTYTIPNINGERLSIVLNPEMEEGEIWTKDTNKRYGDNRFQAFYSTENLSMRTTYDGDWELEMEQISSDGEHMEGNFYALVTLDKGKRPIELQGVFCLNFGETLPAAKTINDIERQNNSSNGINVQEELPGNDYSYSTIEHYTECKTCHGNKICTECGGWGFKDIDGDGVFDTKCLFCRQKGFCPICNGRGVIYH